MNRSRRPEALPHETVDALMRSAGGRATRQRRAVYAALAARSDHPTAEALFRDIRRRVPGVSLATVYKALDALVKAGAARRLAHVDGATHFDARTDHHDHLRCLGCGRLDDFEAPGRDDRIAALRVPEFTITDHHLELVGYCAACAAARPGAASSAHGPQPKGESQ